MFKKLFSFLILFFLLLPFTFLLSPSPAFAADLCTPPNDQFVSCQQVDSKICPDATPRLLTCANKAGAQTTQCVANDACPAAISELENIFSNILGLVAALAALGCFIMLIVGGFKYLTSGGDQKATASARNTITYAIIGLILLIVAWLILLFIQAITGVDVTQFNIIH